MGETKLVERVPKSFEEQNEIILSIARRRGEIMGAVHDGTATDDDVREWAKLNHFERLAKDASYAENWLQIKLLNEEVANKVASKNESNETTKQESQVE